MSNSSLAIENGFFIFEALNKLDELSKNIEPRTAMVIPRNSEILKKAICVLNKILPIVESNLNVNNLNQFNPELINKILSTPWLEMLKNCILVSIHFPRDNIELHKIYITQIAKIIKACFTERSCEYSQNKEEMIRVISNALLIIDTYDGSNNNTIKELIGYFCPLNPYLAN